jgi:subtilisin family serine protease
MYTYKLGGKNGSTHRLEVADDLVVVRTEKNIELKLAIKSKPAKTTLAKLTPIVRFPEAGVTVLQGKESQDRLVQLRDQAREQFNKEKAVSFAGRVLRDDASGAPVVYTENFFVKFRDGLTKAACEKILKKHHLKIKRRLKYAKNAYFVAAPEGTGLDIFRIAQELLDEKEVELCHPELIRKASRRAVAPQQWHLKQTVVSGKTINAHVNVEAAWQISRGAGIVIAIIDDGIDIDHDEFDSTGKIVSPRDVTEGNNNPRPKDRYYPEDHGTACAGVACANGNHQASGVAPDAKLMPIRLVSNLGSQAEADAFQWAADHGADVISCSWGPADGEWWNPNDAIHNEYVALPDSTRLAIDYAINSGRGGKGCVITWAAGNGNESVENDGYASYDKVIAVAACNDRNTRSVYSDFGESVWCAFPSSDVGYAPFNHPDPQTPGIWTTDREGQSGYNPGVLNPAAPPPGDDHGNYTNDFGGTSSACPGVAGLAALILAANPNLKWNQVKDILRQAAVRIDTTHGSYNSEGHSPYYGYGRPDAAQAVALAQGDAGDGEVGYEKLIWEAVATGRLDATGSEKIYEVNLPATANIALDGPGGVDFDLYVKKGAAPTTTDYDQRAYTNSPDESLKVSPNSAGLHFILVRSYRGSGDFTLKVALE